MAYSKVPFTYTGGPQVFATNFALGVLEVDHIKVTVNGVVDGLGDPIEYAFTYDAATGNVTVTDTLTTGQSGFITRTVPVDALIADFEAGADVSKRNLVRSVKQTLMAVQEAADARAEDSAAIATAVEEINDIQDTIADNVAQTTADRVAAEAAANAADADRIAAAASASAAAASAASTGLPLSLVGAAANYLRVRADLLGYELRTAAQTLADLGAQAASTLLAAIAGLASNGLIVRTGPSGAVARSIAGTANQISVSNGDGVAGNPTISAVIASQSEAEAGTDTVKLITPQRLLQALTFRDRVKAYINLQGQASPVTRAQINIASVTRNSVGDYTFTFTTPLADTNYLIFIATGQSAGSVGDTFSIVTKATNSFRIQTSYINGVTKTAADYSFTDVMVIR